jgi:Uma2 family endonuclease
MSTSSLARSPAITSSSKGIVIGRRLRIPASALTLDGFCRWMHSRRFPPHRKASFVNGEVFLEMSPEELLSNNTAKGDIFGHLWTYANEHDLGQTYADRAMLVNAKAELSTEPDVMFCRWETFTSGRVVLRTSADGGKQKVELHGSPDLVVEVVSRSSATKDLRKLPGAYHLADIPEYWIVDPRKDDLIFRVLRWETAGYVDVPADETGFHASQVLAARVRLTRSQTRIGGWRYRLEIVP